MGLSAPPPPFTDVRTSAGVITLNIDANLPVTIDAATKFLGKVRMRGLAPVVREGGLIVQCWGRILTVGGRW